MQMNITYTKGQKTKETNYAKLNTKREARSTNKCHKFWRVHRVRVNF